MKMFVVVLVSIVLLNLYSREVKVDVNSVSMEDLMPIKTAVLILEERPFFKKNVSEQEKTLSLIKINDAITSLFYQRSTAEEKRKFKKLIYKLLEDYSRDPTFQEIMLNAKMEKGVRGIWNVAMLPFCSAIHCAVCIDFDASDADKIIQAFNNFPQKSVWKRRVIYNFFMNSAQKKLADKPELLKKLVDAIVPADLTLE